MNEQVTSYKLHCGRGGDAVRRTNQKTETAAGMDYVILSRAIVSSNASIAVYNLKHLVFLYNGLPLSRELNETPRSLHLIVITFLVCVVLGQSMLAIHHPS